jgi:hypothetical protein
MRNLWKKRATRTCACPLSAAIFLVMLSGLSMAQHGASPAPPQDLSMRENRVSAMEAEKNKKNNGPKDPRAAMAQVNEDFGSIQDVNNDLLKSVSAQKSLDYGYISQATAEIKMRAVRLRNNLALTTSGKNKKQDRIEVGPEEAGLTRALSVLSALIQDFVTNPIFKSTVIDADQASKARHDLDAIIDLSDRIRKNADEMKKTSR